VFTALWPVGPESMSASGGGLADQRGDGVVGKQLPVAFLAGHIRAA